MRCLCSLGMHTKWIRMEKSPPKKMEEKQTARFMYFHSRTNNSTSTHSVAFFPKQFCVFVHNCKHCYFVMWRTHTPKRHKNPLASFQIRVGCVYGGREFLWLHQKHVHTYWRKTCWAPSKVPHWKKTLMNIRSSTICFVAGKAGLHAIICLCFPSPAIQGGNNFWCSIYLCTHVFTFCSSKPRGR